MKKKIFESLYRILSFLSDSIGIRYLTKYKVLLGTSLLMLASCQMIKKNDQDEDCFVSSDSKDDPYEVSCYLPIIQEPEPEEGDPSDENYVHRVVDELPQFPGGEDKMNEYIYKRIKYPRAALENEISGRVAITMVVEKDGSLNEIDILRGVDPDLDNEALRVIKGMPKWKPGKQNGKEVRVKYTVLVRFRLPPY